MTVSARAVEAMKIFVLRAAHQGLNADLSPTMPSSDPELLYNTFTKYLRRIDGNFRSEAMQILTLLREPEANARVIEKSLLKARADIALKVYQEHQNITRVYKNGKQHFECALCGEWVYGGPEISRAMESLLNHQLRMVVIITSQMQ